MQRKCQGCNKTFTPPNYSMMRCRSCAKGVGYPKKLTEAEIKERDLEQNLKKDVEEGRTKRAYHMRESKKEKKTPCTCHICGTEFLGSNKCCKYCSKECREKGNLQYSREYNEKRRNERKCK